MTDSLIEMCGGAYAIVPADVIENNDLSRDARWLFSILCRHADATGMCRRSLTRLAEQEGCTTRSLQRWMYELEAAGLVSKVNDRGKVGAFRIARDPSDRDELRQHNLASAIARRTEFGEYGRRGAERRHTRDTAVTPSDTEVINTRDTAVAPPVTRLSHRTRPVKQDPLTGPEEQPRPCGQVAPPTAQQALLLPLPGGRPTDRLTAMEARARDRAAAARAETEAADRETANRDALIGRAAELLESGGHAKPSRARAMATLGMSLVQADSRVCDAAAGRAVLPDSDLLALVLGALVMMEPTSAVMEAQHG